MSWRDIGRAVFGSSPPANQPSVPSTLDLERQRKQAAKRSAKEAEQAAGRRRRHREIVARGGSDDTPFGFEEKRRGRRRS